MALIWKNFTVNRIFLFEFKRILHFIIKGVSESFIVCVLTHMMKARCLLQNNNLQLSSQNLTLITNKKNRQA